MIKVLIFAFLMMLCSYGSVRCEEINDIEVKDKNIEETKEESISVSLTDDGNVVFSRNDKVVIYIDMVNCKVTICDECKMEEASLLFWESVYAVGIEIKKMQDEIEDRMGIEDVEEDVVYINI